MLFLKKMLLLISMSLIIGSCKQDIKSVVSLDSDTISVIPQPQSIEAIEGVYTIQKKSKINYQGDLKDIATLLSTQLNTKNTIQEFKTEAENQILLAIAKNEKLEKEGYELTINENGIKIEGDAAGVFYGIQTLSQLLIEANGKTVVPYVHIIDNPRFEWRGMHLDVSRHFFDVAFVKKYIDILAKHKLNVFHWHLTDDHGWRIAIDKYPKLTEVGAWRLGDGMEKPWTYNVNGARKDKPKYGGFYTKDDIIEVVAYAKERFMTVVPEIELPGHSWAALHAYPELSCTGRDWHLGKEWSFSDPFCVGNEDTFTFFEDVLTEVIDLFPSPYIHIGGDEAQKTKWEHCRKCQARIKKEGLKNEEELQSYFIKRIEKFVRSKGRKIIGWDEILEGGLAPDATVMSWRGEEGGIAAAQQKHDVIMTPGDILYFNQAQYNPKLEGIEMARIVNVEKVYHYNPVPEVLNTDEQKYIKGVQACLWSEYIYNDTIAMQRLLPRLLALSEIAWTETKNKSWERFQGKLTNHLPYFDNQNLTYFITPPTSNGLNSFVADSIFVELESQFKDTPIFYTLDGSEPNTTSTKYTTPIIVNDSVLLKAKTILSSEKESPIFEKTFRKITYQEAAHLTNPIEGLILNYFKKSMNQLSEFEKLKKASQTIITTKIALPENINKGNFALEFNGYIKIPKDDIYTFYTSSDDGSGLYINDLLIVDNDGFHGMQEKKGEVALKEGYHKFSIRYFEGGGGKGLKVTMQSTTLKKDTIHSDLLFYTR